MFFRKKINTLDMETQVNTITAQQARKLTEESISKVRQKAVSDELDKIYSRVREIINDGFGHNFFSFHITTLEGESEESRKKRTDIVKTELLYQGYDVRPLCDEWFEISW